MNCEVKLTNNNNNKNFLLSSPVTVYSYGCYGFFYSHFITDHITNTIKKLTNLVKNWLLLQDISLKYKYLN